MSKKVLKTLKRTSLVIAVVLLGGSSLLMPNALAATTANQKQLSFGPAGEYILGSVEDQPGVVNTTGCPWSGYDFRYIGGYGDVAAKTTVTGQTCVVESNLSREISTDVVSGVDSLVVTLTVGDESFVATPVNQGQGNYLYHVETYAGGYDISTLPVIPNTNGGRGEIETVKITVYNPTKLNAKGRSAGLNIYSLYGYGH